MASRILLTAFELDLFHELSLGRQTLLEITEALDTELRATETLLDALAALNILTKDDDRYSMRNETEKALATGSPDYIGDDLRHVCRLWQPWSDLTRVLRLGRPPHSDGDPEARMDLALAMRRQAREAAPRIAALLRGSKMDTALDLGGGPGCYAIALAQRCPRLRVDLFDHDDQALTLAVSDITEAGLGKRVRIRKGDFLVDPIGSGYDLVLVSSILCTLAEEEILLLLRKVKHALREGGLVVINDLMLDETRTGPLSAALFSVSMLVTTPGGRAYSCNELSVRLEELGFERVHRIPMPPMSLMIGKKPD